MPYTNATSSSLNVTSGFGVREVAEDSARIDLRVGDDVGHSRVRPSLVRRGVASLTRARADVARTGSAAVSQPAAERCSRWSSPSAAVQCPEQRPPAQQPGCRARPWTTATTKVTEATTNTIRILNRCAPSRRARASRFETTDTKPRTSRRPARAASGHRESTRAALRRVSRASGRAATCSDPP